VFGRSAPASAAQPVVTKDPRPLRDKSVQSAMWDDIVRWLKQTGFEGSDFRLSSINGHSFRAIFEHLVSAANSSYYFPPPEDTREKAKWEAEFVAAVNWLRYPFPVDVKWLAAPLTPHSWPSLLGLLHWLSDMGKVEWLN
jgi:kinetochore protein NDC80